MLKVPTLPKISLSLALYDNTVDQYQVLSIDWFKHVKSLIFNKLHTGLVDTDKIKHTTPPSILSQIGHHKKHNIHTTKKQLEI